MGLLKYLLNKKFKEEYSREIELSLSYSEDEVERIYSDIYFESSKKVS